MQKALLFVFLLFSPILGYADAQQLNYQGVEYDVYAVNAKDPGLSFYWKDDEGNLIGNFTGLERYLDEKNKTMLFATNGGIFNKDYIPLGLYVENFKTLVPINLAQGNGDFYRQPNGVFLVNENGFAIVQTAAIKNEFGIKYAIQSGPMLVHENKINSSFQRNSNKYRIRSGVGINRKSQAIFAISNEEVSFYTFAKFFKRKLHCSNALFLDGENSRMHIPQLGRYQSSGKFATLIGIVIEK